MTCLWFGWPSFTSRLRRRTFLRMKEYLWHHPNVKGTKMVRNAVYFIQYSYQWFFTWLSVLPGSRLAISDHRLPNSLWASAIIRSSSSVHACLFILGSVWELSFAIRKVCGSTREEDKILDVPRWLCQRSRHCFPDLPWILKSLTTWSAMTDQLRVPCYSTVWKKNKGAFSVLHSKFNSSPDFNSRNLPPVQVDGLHRPLHLTTHVCTRVEKEQCQHILPARNTGSEDRNG